VKLCPVTMLVEVIEVADRLSDFMVVGAAGHERLIAIKRPENGGKAALVMLSGPGTGTAIIKIRK